MADHKPPGYGSDGNETRRERTEDESAAAKKRSLLATLHSAVVVNQEVAKRHGQLWDSAPKDGWGALPGAPVDRVDAAISARAADLCGKTIGTGPSKEEEKMYAPHRQDGSRS